MCCCVQVWVICPTSDKRVKVEHFISKRTYKPIVDGFPELPSMTQQWYQSLVRQRVQPRQPVRLRRKQQRRYKALWTPTKGTTGVWTLIFHLFTLRVNSYQSLVRQSSVQRWSLNFDFSFIHLKGKFKY